ncbi:MAG: DNA-directed RNA polymerase subunit beta', partial [Planctomycetota bacterium]
LNRAPTLHRVGIQAFQPVLVEGNAIKVHPLVCGGFNADFDGDQMAVHLPLSFEAQIEASTLMLAPNNIFSPADGRPIIAPSQDIVLGIGYLTTNHDLREGDPLVAGSLNEAFLAYGTGKLKTHSKVKLKLDRDQLYKGARDEDPAPSEGLVETTMGRIVFNDILEPGMPFYNYELTKKGIQEVISDCHKYLGREKTIKLLDDIKDLGFKSATRAGVSFAKDDMRTPKRKDEIMAKSEGEVDTIEKNYRSGVITDGERYNQIIDCWTAAREEIGKEMMTELAADERDGKPYLNPIYLMAETGARGSVEQIRQLAGMRGLMAKPSGKIIETPIKANFREGLKVLEYFSSTHGARKGLADTALKTADSGYLTRKLADVAQNVVITMQDCGTLNGISKGVVYKGDKVEVSLAQAITGRVARDRIVDVITDEVVIEENEVITPEIARRIEQMGYERIRVRSPLTCEAPLGVCALCYGMDLSRGKVVERGLAAGIIAAQSIGEPGTQLTMRTFHIGGTAHKTVEDAEFRSRYKGVVKFDKLKAVRNDKGELVVLNRNGELVIEDEQGREVDRHLVPAGAVVHAEEGAAVKERQVLCRWDPHHIPIISEREGVVKYDEIVDGKTMREEKDEASGVKRKQIIEHKGDLHPQVIITDKDDQPLALYPVPERAYLEVDNGQKVKAGTLIAKTPREITGTQDITGGLPRVTELFEARKPKDPAVMSEIDGLVALGDKKRGKRVLRVQSPTGIEKEHLIPQGKHLLVHNGDRVRSGEPLTEGPLVPHDILRISGEESVQNYLLREVQNVYRSQNVTIDDKHIEIIVSQMMRKVRIEDPGDTEFLPGSVADKYRFREANKAVIESNGRPARATPLLLGITKASLQSDSFISAASFQETTKVLTEAALAGRTDRLVGLKENVILGHLIPAGTGFGWYSKASLKRNVTLEDEIGFDDLLGGPEGMPPAVA